MAYLNTFSITQAPCPAVDPALLDARTKAHVRAAESYFGRHIIRTDDGCYWVADEGSYETSGGPDRRHHSGRKERRKLTAGDAHAAPFLLAPNSHSGPAVLAL